MIKLISILFFLLMASFIAKAEEVIRLTSGEWPPYLSQDLKYNGLVSRIVFEAFALEGVKVEYIFLPWSRAYKEALIGKYDGSVIWTHNPEREKSFDYSDVVIEGHSVFFHMKNYSFDWESSEDLLNRNIGGTLGYKYALLEKLEAKGKVKIHRVPTDGQNFYKLLHQRIDIFQQDKEAGYYWLQTNLSTTGVQKFTHHPKHIVTDAYHLIFSKHNAKNTHFIHLFNKGLKRLKKNGKYEQYISESHLGKYIQRREVPQA